MEGRPALVNTLSVSAANEGTRTMLVELLRAVRVTAPDRRLTLLCSRDNRPLFDGLGYEVVEAGPGTGPLRTVRRIWRDQVTAPRLARRRGEPLVTAAGVPALWSRTPQVALVSYHLAVPSCRVAAGNDRPDLMHRLYYGAPFRVGLRRCAAVLGISDFLAKALSDELGVDRARVGSMPLGVVAPEAAPDIGPRPPVLLFVGTLYRYKDVDVALRAFARAAPSLPAGARFVIAGKDPDGEQIPALETLAQGLGVAGSVDVLGMVGDEELERLYAESAVLILPSRCEGFGLPVAESMARGTPVIVADATSLPEVAGAGGICVRPGDVAGFADAIEAVLGDPAVHRDLSEKGRARAASLSWSVTAAALLDTIDGLAP